MTTHAQRIATIEESFESAGTERTLRASIASAERDRARLENVLAKTEQALADALALIEAQTAVMKQAQADGFVWSDR